MKILSAVFAAIILFSAATADAFSAVLYGFIKLPETANLTPDNVSIYVVGREQKIAKPEPGYVYWDPKAVAWGFSADTDNMETYDVVIMNGENVVAVVNFNELRGFGFLTYDRTDNLIPFTDIVSFVPCRIYESIQMLECGK